MTIYVDQIAQHSNGLWCHIMTDGDIEELHAFAGRIGMRREWFQNKNPRHLHYDLRPRRRAAAIKAGAMSVSSAEMIRRCIRNKEATCNQRTKEFGDATLG